MKINHSYDLPGTRSFLWLTWHQVTPMIYLAPGHSYDLPGTRSFLWLTWHRVTWKRSDENQLFLWLTWHRVTWNSHSDGSCGFCLPIALDHLLVSHMTQFHNQSNFHMNLQVYVTHRVCTTTNKWMQYEVWLQTMQLSTRHGSCSI